MTADRLRTIEVADVYKGDRPAGRLARDGDTVSFSYLPEYLADEGDPVAWTLPLTDRPVRTTGGSVPPFFAGLLPEGARLNAVIAATKTSADDQLTLLLGVGRDTVGDVRVLPAGESADPPTAPVDAVGEVPDLRDLFRSTTTPEAVEADPSALPGVQIKVSSERFSAPVQTTTGPAILKLAPPQQYPRLVENEHFFMSLARECGLEVAEQRLIHDGSGVAGLLVARFDRVHAADGTLIRLAQEDACQLSGKYPASKYRLKTEDIVRTLAATSERGGGSARQVTLETLRLTAYSYAIGNGDLHGKNFSLYRSPAGIWTTTPAYDLLCTQPYLRWQDPMALDLYGRANKLSRAHFLSSAERLSVPPRAMVRALDTICRGVVAGSERVAEIGFDDRTTGRLREMLLRRADELS